MQVVCKWWAHQDLNLEPTDYESAALTVELWARPRYLYQRPARFAAIWRAQRTSDRRALVHLRGCPNHLARPVLLIYQDHDGFVRCQFRLAVAGIGADDQNVSDRRLSRGRPIQ